MTYFFPDHVKKAQEKINFGKVGNVMILLLVWNTFCNTFHRKVHLGAGSWVPMLFLEWGLYIFFTIMCLVLGTFVPLKRIFSLDKPDAVALTMCGATKTLALGMPLISVLYGKNANAGVLSLPLLIYHATQILIGSLLIKPLKRWVEGPSPGAWPASCWPTADSGAGGEGQAAKGPPGSSNSCGSSTGDEREGAAGSGSGEGDVENGQVSLADSVGREGSGKGGAKS